MKADGDEKLRVIFKSFLIPSLCSTETFSARNTTDCECKTTTMYLLVIGMALSMNNSSALCLPLPCEAFPYKLCTSTFIPVTFLITRKIIDNPFR